ncbi:mitochondrial carrier [Amylocystis lapponica]|nr:mitochondrial carrier [Amylocystis lapponica]
MNSEDNNVKPSIDPALDFFAGTVAGMTALAVGFPLDTVKVRFQNPSVALKYHSTMNAVFTILREERVRGLYRGIASPMVSCAPLNGLVFASYRSLMKAQLGEDEDIPTLTQITLAGAGSGIIASLITTPTELIKIHQQSLLPSEVSAITSRSGVRAHYVVLQILKTHGIKGLYRGITATALRDIGYGVYFATYEATLRYFPSPPPLHDNTSLPSEADSMIASHSWPALLLAGGLAGITGWLVTFPFDVIKTRMQCTLADTPGNPYRNTWSTTMSSYRTEGLGVFFRGLAPTIIRAIPVNMVTFATFEAVVHALA